MDGIRRLGAGALLCVPALLVVGGPIQGGQARMRRNSFGSDPKWESERSRLLDTRPRPSVRQAFGYSRSRRAGGRATGEIGGWIQRSVTPAWYALRVPACGLDQRLEASGRFAVTRADGGSGMLFGWFHETSRGWRAPNSLVLRLDGNGGRFWVFFEYGTRSWRTGCVGCFEGDRYQTTPTRPFAADGSPHDWRLAYDPDANGGNGLVRFTLDGFTRELPLAPGHRREGATFNRFGMVNLQVSGDGMEAYFDDIVLNGRRIGFDADPGWEGSGNRSTAMERFVRPLHDFGWSPTRHAGGARGEIGGVVWRDEAIAYYADRVSPVTLDGELHAEGRIALLRACSDSAVYIGWFASSGTHREGPADRDELRDFLGVLLEGPSEAGHYFRASYRTSSGEGRTEPEGPILRPDASAHRWSVDYSPPRAGRAAKITVRLDAIERVCEIRFPKGGACFDRFGIRTFGRGGLFLELYLDDLVYTGGP